MSIIKKHPVAFMVFIGFELMGLSALLAVSATDEHYWLFGIAGLLFLHSLVIMAAAAVTFVVRLVSSRNPPKDISWDFIADLAREYMLKTPFVTVYIIAVVLLSPILPVLLVHVLEKYMFGVLLMMLGVMIFMLAIFRDAVARRFFRLRDTGQYFSMESGDDDELLRSFYGDLVHVYTYDGWEEAKADFICNLLRHTKGLNGTIRCYMVSGECINRIFGTQLNENFDQLVLVPFSQFALSPENGQTLVTFMDRLSLMRFTTLADLCYGRKRSLDPMDYAHSGKNLSLRPTCSDVKCAGHFGSELRIVFSKCSSADSSSNVYHDCLMVAKNARHDGSEEAARLEERLLCAEVVYINGFDISDVVMTLRLIIDDDIDAENWTHSEKEYSPEHTMRYEFDGIEWYWDGFCDTSGTKAVLDRIHPTNH